MKLKICEANRTAIEAALFNVNGTAVSFTVDSFDFVASVAEGALDTMSADGLTIKERSGARVKYRPAGPRASSYGYSAKSTRIEITVGSNGKDCYLTGIELCVVHPKLSELLVMELKPDNKSSWLSRVSDKYL